MRQYLRLEDLEIVLGMMIEIKGVPVDIAHSVIVADKVSLRKTRGRVQRES